MVDSSDSSPSATPAALLAPSTVGRYFFLSHKSSHKRNKPSSLSDFTYRLDNVPGNADIMLDSDSRHKSKQLHQEISEHDSGSMQQNYHRACMQDLHEIERLKRFKVISQFILTGRLHKSIANDSVMIHSHCSDGECESDVANCQLSNWIVTDLIFDVVKTSMKSSTFCNGFIVN